MPTFLVYVWIHEYTIPLYRYRYNGSRNSCWAEISVSLIAIHDCMQPSNAAILIIDVCDMCYIDVCDMCCATQYRRRFFPGRRRLVAPEMKMIQTRKQTLHGLTLYTGERTRHSLTLYTGEKIRHSLTLYTGEKIRHSL